MNNINKKITHAITDYLLTYNYLDDEWVGISDDYDINLLISDKYLICNLHEVVETDTVLDRYETIVSIKKVKFKNKSYYIISSEQDLFYLTLYLTKSLELAYETSNLMYKGVGLYKLKMSPDHGLFVYYESVRDVTYGINKINKKLNNRINKNNRILKLLKK